MKRDARDILLMVLVVLAALWLTVGRTIYADHRACIQAGYNGAAVRWSYVNGCTTSPLDRLPGQIY